MKSTPVEKYISYGNEPPSSEDEDSAPEEVGFEKSKKVAKRVQKHVSDLIQAQNDKVKQKRKKIHERNAAQKQAKAAKIVKLRELDKKELPSEFLEKICLLQSKKQTANSAPVHVHFNDEDNISLNKTESKVEEEHHSKNKGPADFISIHGSTKFSVVPLKLQNRKSNSAAALEFKNRFLGGKDVCRETVPEMVSKAQKQSLNKRFT